MGTASVLVDRARERGLRGRVYLVARTAAYSLPANLRVVLQELASADAVAGERWMLALLQRHGPGVVNVLWRMLGREDDVLDVYQTVVCSLASRGPRRVGRNRAAYFYRSAINAAISLIRRRQRDRERLERLARRRQHTSSGGDPAVNLEHLHLVEQLRAAILELPGCLRDVIVLRDLAGLPYSQVSKIMGITCGSARVYRRQAVIRLSDMLAEEAS